MHQYHLGQHEEEKEGELVVSKIFYQTQPRQCNWSERSGAAISGGVAGDVVVVAAAGADATMRRETGSGSCSSSKEMIMPQRDDYSAAAVSIAGGGPPIPSYAGIDIHQLKADHFGYLPFRKSFDHEVYIISYPFQFIH